MQLVYTSALSLGVSLFLVVVPGESTAGDKNEIEWLRGTGKELEICLKGEVLETNGQPAKEIKITCQQTLFIGSRQLQSVIHGHRFEIWIPVNDSRWSSLTLSASSAKNDFVASLMIDPRHLRQAAVNEVKLTLKNPTRQVVVKVVDHGQPVPEAMVKLNARFGVELQSRTDRLGMARLRLLPDWKLDHLMAWTDDFRIAGYYFDRRPVRDPNVDEHLVELSPCRDQKIRFVDQNGMPVAGIPFQLKIATAPPNYNFIGTNQHSAMTTDANGEILDKWFPDWEDCYCYPELGTDEWVNDSDDQNSLDSVTVFKVKKSRIADRKRVTGQVNPTRSRAGGFYVTLDSFQGEQKRRRDVLGVFTNADGSFSFDVLPDSTYCAFVCDARWVSEIIDLIPYVSELDQVNTPRLTVVEGMEVEVIVTSGPNKLPYSNLEILFQREHSFKFLAEREMQFGTGGAQWWLTTDDSGRAVTKTLPGRLKMMVFTQFWKVEETVTIDAGKPVKLFLHRDEDP